MPQRVVMIITLQFVSTYSKPHKNIYNKKIVLLLLLCSTWFFQGDKTSERLSEEVIAMTGIFLFSVFCFLWLIGLSLLAEVWFFEEEEQL